MGGITVVLSAATGIAQRSITRIAVCAVSAEIGLGIVAVGMGGYSAGVFIAITSMFTSTLLLLAVGNLVRVYRTDDIAEMGGAWAKLRTTSVALGVWTVLAGGSGFSAYYAVASALSGIDPGGRNLQRNRARRGGHRHGASARCWWHCSPVGCCSP